MTVYVDTLHDWGWKLRGRKTESCHLFTDNPDIEELHVFALRIGMRREWFQLHKVSPHYDLTKARRDHAIQLGAVEVSWREASRIWRNRREGVALSPTPSQTELPLS